MKNKGITLIALIITIIIMIILAGISINLIFGDNGIITKAKLAKKVFLGEDAKKVVEERVNSLVQEKTKTGEDADLYDFWYMYNCSESDLYDPEFIIYLFEQSTASTFTIKGNDVYSAAKPSIYKSAVVIYKGFQITIDSSLTVEKEVIAVEDLTVEEIENIQLGIHPRSTNDVTETVIQFDYVESRYVVVEIYDHLNGNCAAINEIEIYDSGNNKKTYNVIGRYDPEGSSNSYWTREVWGGDNLNDGTLSYTHDGLSSTIFLEETPGTGNYARLLLDLGSYQDIGKVIIYVGNERTPQQLKVYTVPNLTSLMSSEVTSICQKQSEERISLMGIKIVEKIVTSSVPYDFSFKSETVLPIITTQLRGELNENNINISISVKDEDSGFGKVEIYYRIIRGQYVEPIICTGGAIGTTDINTLTTNLNNLSDGIYEIYAKVYDKEGNYINSNQIIINKGNVIDYISRYVVVEIYDHLNGNCAAINEIEIYDFGNNKKTYNVIGRYDPEGSSNSYWTREVWGGDNLNDGTLSYTHDGLSSTIFLKETPGTGSYARLLLDLGSYQDIGKVIIYVGNERTPQQLKVYTVPNLRSLMSSEVTSICQKQSEEKIMLTGIKTVEKTITSSVPYDFIHE